MSDCVSSAYYRGLVDSAVQYYCWLCDNGIPKKVVLDTMYQEFSDELKSLDAFYGVEKDRIEASHVQDLQKFTACWSRIDEIAKQPEYALTSDQNGTCIKQAKDTAMLNLSEIHEKDNSNFKIRYMLDRASIEKRHDEVKSAVQWFIETGKIPIPSGIVAPHVYNIKNELSPEPTVLKEEPVEWHNMTTNDFDFAFAPSGDSSSVAEPTSWLPEEASASYSEMHMKPQENTETEVDETPVIKVQHKERRKQRKGTVRVATREYMPRRGTRGKNYH